MPWHKRGNLSFTPESLHNIQDEDDSDYLLDPDQMLDILPQPYRMINKILTHVLDSVYDIVEQKQDAILIEARKPHPPKFDESLMLDLFQNATTLASSADYKYIFVGLPDGLAVFDPSTESMVHSWKQERTEIAIIKSYMIGPDYHFLITQDDMATVRLFLFACATLFFVKAINENSPENSTKILCHKFDASAGGEYAGFIFEQTSTEDVWLEVHKLPVEEWHHDLNDIKQESEKKKDPEEDVEDEETEKKSLPATPGKKSPIQERPSIKFSYPIPVLRVRPPQTFPLPASTSPNIAAAVRKVDTGDVLGMGLNHLLDANHLNSRDAMFLYRYESKIKYLPEEKEAQPVYPTFHFLNSSKFITSSLDLAVSDKVPVNVIVWWSGSPHLCHYSLLKSAKVSTEETSSSDLESKPEAVWPFTSNIICTCISPCTTYLSVGLTNGNIVLWDIQMGLLRGVLNGSTKSAIKSLRFLDTCLFPCAQPDYPPYPQASATFLLAEYDSGLQLLLDTCHGTEQIPRCVAEEPENDDDIQILLQVVPGLPELMIYVQKNGNLYIKDIDTGTAICQIVLPPTHQFQTPWNPILVFGESGKIVYVKGEGTEVTDEGTLGDISGIFKFDLASCHALEAYMAQKYEKKELNVYITHEQRVSALLKERMQQQPLRKIRLQQRWNQLGTELNVTQKTFQRSPCLSFMNSSIIG